MISLQQHQHNCHQTNRAIQRLAESPLRGTTSSRVKGTTAAPAQVNLYQWNQKGQWLRLRNGVSISNTNDLAGHRVDGSLTNAGRGSLDDVLLIAYHIVDDYEGHGYDCCYR